MGVLTVQEKKPEFTVDFGLIYVYPKFESNCTVGFLMLPLQN